MLRPFLLAFFLAGMLCGCNGDSGSSETVTSGVNESPSVEPETRPTKTVANKISDEENELDTDNGIQPRIGGGINTGKASDTESIATTNSASLDTNTLEENITSVQSIQTNVSIDSSLNSGTEPDSQTESASSPTPEQTTTDSGTRSDSQAETTSSSTSEQTTTESGTTSNSQTETTSISTPEQTTTDSDTASNSQTETTSSSTSEQTTTGSDTASNSQTETTSISTPEQTTTESGTRSDSQAETTSSSTSEQTTTDSDTASNSQTESASSSTSEQTTTESDTASDSQTETTSSSTSEQTTTDSGTASNSQTESASNSAPEQTTNDGVESSSQTSTATSSTSGQITTNDETVSGSKTGATTNTSPTYRFIDSPVEGLFYTTSSGHSGVTGAQGQFEANEDDVVTFYLGDKNGIKLGTASVQTVLTPFEITGKYTRAVALARLFLSLDNQYGLPEDNTLTIPSYLSQSLSKQNLAVLSYLRLNNMDSVRTVLIGLGISSFNIVTESQAVHHLEASLKQVSRGDAGKSNPFANREIMHIKHVVLPQNKVDANLIVQPIHIDKVLDDQYFGFTDGMPFEDFTLEGEVITKLATSNSKLIQIPYEYKPAGFYHTLLSAVKDTNFNSSHYRATAESNLFTVSGQTDLYDVSIKVQPLVVDQWWERQVTSLFYDPTTQVFTKTEKIAQLSGFNIDCGMYDCFETWSSEAVSYYYPVSVPSGERYIDFVGTWLETRVCFDGTIAKRTLVFDDTKLTATGSMCLNRTSVPVMGTLELSYEDLQHTEFWWFNQIGRQSKATLSELNSTIRLTTPELYPRSYSCVNPHEITVKWEYHPAGENWDRGLLNKTRINCDGTINLYSTMQKQF